MNRENENNRNLTPDEKARSLRFEKAKNDLLQKGYAEKDLTVGLVHANIMAIVLGLPIILCLAAAFFLCNKGILSEISLSPDLPALIKLTLFFVAFFILAAVHELIHGVTWSIFAKKHWRSISFGFIAKYMTPYCSCSEALNKAQYITGVLMPTLLLGVVPAVISIINGSIWLFAMGAVMILVGGGDLTILLKLIQFKAGNEDTLYMDHPYQAGVVAFVKQN